MKSDLEKLRSRSVKLSHLFLIGKLKKYRAIKADCIAAAMISMANSLPELQIVSSDLIQEIGSNQYIHYSYISIMITDTFISVFDLIIFLGVFQGYFYPGFLSGAGERM